MGKREARSLLQASFLWYILLMEKSQKTLSDAIMRDPVLRKEVAKDIVDTMFAIADRLKRVEEDIQKLKNA